MEFLASVASVSQGLLPPDAMLNAFIPPVVGLVAAALAFVLTTMRAKPVPAEAEIID